MPGSIACEATAVENPHELAALGGKSCLLAGPNLAIREAGKDIAEEKIL